jgi:CheY-like chemotaxis protein
VIKSCEFCFNGEETF